MYVRACDTDSIDMPGQYRNFMDYIIHVYMCTCVLCLCMYDQINNPFTGHYLLSNYISFFIIYYVYIERVYKGSYLKIYKG